MTPGASSPAAPAIEMVPCPPMAARLTLPGCIRLWRGAQEGPVQATGTKAHCRSCELGAERAGAPPEQRIFAPAEAIRLVCPRCERVAQRLIHGRHCVSCYNRDREVARGRNCKGGRPRLASVLHRAELVVADTAPPRMVAAERVIGPAEAILRVAKRVRGPTLFGRPPARLPDAA